VQFSPTLRRKPETSLASCWFLNVPLCYHQNQQDIIVRVRVCVRVSMCVCTCACLCRNIVYCPEIYLFSITFVLLLYCNGTSSTMGIGDPLRRVNRPGRDSNRSPSTKVKNKWLYTSNKLIYTSNK